jgi:gamma-glutamylputrescine oxidase
LSPNALTATTWYDQTGIAPPQTMALADLAPAYDTVIVGGGLAGLSLLWHLAEAGVSAALLDAGRIAGGASGRNGGFCSAGWAAGEDQVIRLVGKGKAAVLEDAASGGVRWMRERMGRKGYEGADPKVGILTVSLSGRPPAVMDAASRLLTGAALKAETTSPRYRYGFHSDGGVQFHPLNFMRALAGDALGAGQAIVEGAKIDRIDRQGSGLAVTSGRKTIQADLVVLATGGYGGPETGGLSRLLLPIRTYIGVTDPMPDILSEHIPTRAGVGDTRRAGNYYRRLPDGRLLWGLGITAFGTLEVEAVRRMVAKDIGNIYPGLARDMHKAAVGIDTAWAGNMGYARHFMPYVGEIEPGLFTIAGFGGHGMNTAPAAAIALSKALLGEPAALEPFSAIPRQATFGPIGAVAAEASYRWRQMNDRLAETLS